jgi:hypothetical protein
MKPFMLQFDGKAALSYSGGPDKVDCKLTIQGTDLELIGKSMGDYASAILKQQRHPHLATILIIAYYRFRELNPEMTEAAERALGGDSLITVPTLKWTKPQ